LVGPQGRVLAEDIRGLPLLFLRLRALLLNQHNVTIVRGEPDDPHLPAEGVDAILVANTCHELTDTGPILDHVFRALRPGGRLVVVDPSPARGGRYRIVAKKAGFSDFTLAEVRLDARQALRVKATLSVAAMSETIEVSSGPATALNTESGTIGDTKSFEQVTEVPVNYLGGSILRPNRIGDGNVAHPTPDHYFDIGAFAAPPANAGRIGNGGVGILTGPGTLAISGGLAKAFALGARARLRFETTFTNLPNHPNFAPPAADASTPATFGRTTSVQTAEGAGNRVGQVSLRLESLSRPVAFLTAGQRFLTRS